MVKGDEIKKLREARGMSARDLARAAGIDKNTVLKAETGASMQTAKLEAIAAALGMPPAYFLG
jgi:transcriptional regulator with XRE-family HTH domain